MTGSTNDGLDPRDEAVLNLLRDAAARPRAWHTTSAETLKGGERLRLRRRMTQAGAALGITVVGLVAGLTATGFGSPQPDIATVAPHDTDVVTPEEECAVPAEKIFANRAFRGTPAAQRATEEVDAVLHREVGSNTKGAASRRLQGGVIGIAGDADRGALAVVVDPSQVDVDNLRSKLAAERDEEAETKSAAVYVRTSCHPASALLRAYRVLSERNWHSEARDFTFGFSLNEYDSTWHVGMPEGAAATALKEQLGALVRITYEVNDGMPSGKGK